MNECGETDDLSVCNSIKVEYDDFYCYKANNLFGEYNETCIPYPKKKDEQKMYWDLYNGLNKELLSSIGKYINEEINLEELYSQIESRTPTQKEMELIMSATLKELLEEEIFFKSKREFYDINEIVETETASLTSKDKEVFASENTCGYHMMRKFLYEQKAENITEKNTCFKVNKFDDLKDILDCGYAIFKYKIDGQNYEYRTCFLLPTTNMPKNFSMMFTDSIKTAIEDGGFIEDLLSTAAGKGENEYGNIADKKSSRRLSEMTYTVEVENKDGRKVKYSSDKANLGVIAEGTKTKPEESENGSGKNKISYLTFGLILLISIL